MRLLTPLRQFSAWLHSDEPVYLLAAIFAMCGLVTVPHTLGAALSRDMAALFTSGVTGMLCATASNLMLAQVKRTD